MTLLWPGEGDIQADIVFVHGFGGDALETWTSGSACWPRDFLKHDIDQVRISTWGYDTSVIKSIFDVSKKLLHDIAKFRTDHTSRPLIILCHSLGGLIVKEVLLRSSERWHGRLDHESGAIYASCKGVVFFGTPHRGSGKTSMGKLVSHVATFALQNPNDRLIQALKQDSEILERQRSSLASIAENISMACFYETFRTAVGPVSSFIVPEDSACIHGRNVRVAGIAANHEEICKFASRDDDGYRTVLGSIKSFIKEAIDQQIEAGVPAPGQRSETMTSRPSSGATPLTFENVGRASSPGSSANTRLKAFSDAWPMSADSYEVGPRGSPANVERHRCPYCSTDFKRHHNLKSHLLTHSQEKPYVCQKCSARFRRLHDLNRHTKLHTVERPHTCDKCGRKFARDDALARHNKSPGGCAGRRPSFGTDDGANDSRAGNNSIAVDYQDHDEDDHEGEDSGDNGRVLSESSRKRAHLESVHGSAASSEFHVSTFSGNGESLVYYNFTAPTGVSAEVSEQREPGLSNMPGFSSSTPVEDTHSLISIDNDAVSVDESVTSVGERTAATEYLVKAFTEDEELSTLYQDICTGPQRLERTNFLTAHRHLLRQFYLDAEAVADSPQEKAAVRFLRYKTKRQQISSLVYHSAAGCNLVELNTEEKTGKQGGTESYRASLPNDFNSQDQAPDRIKLSEVSVEEDEEHQSEEDDEDGYTKMLNVESAGRFLTQGYACMAYKVRLRRLAQGLPPAEKTFQQAIQAKEGKKAQALLGENGAAIFRGKDYYVFRQLIDQGYSYESIVATLINLCALNAHTGNGAFLEMLQDRQVNSVEAAEERPQDNSITVSARTSQGTLLQQGSASSAATKLHSAQGDHAELPWLIISSFGGMMLVLVTECLLILWLTSIAKPAEIRSMIHASVPLILCLCAGQLPIEVFVDIPAAATATVTAIKARTTRMTTRTLRPGYSRVTWICLCGRSYTQEFDVNGGLKALNMYKTFSEAGYRTILQASATPSPDEGRTFQERYIHPIRILNDAIPSLETALGNAGRSSGIQSLDQQLAMRQQRHRENGANRHTSSRVDETDTKNTVEIITSSDSEEERDVPRKWLLFCFDHREIISKMKHIRLSKESSDLDLFPILRNKYYSYKITWWMRWLGLTRFVPYLVDYDIKTASFVKFRLLPDLRFPNGMPSKLEEWKPDLYWNQGSEWEPAQIGDRPDIDARWFLCHWAHPDEDWLRFWKSVTETLGDARTNIGKATLYASALWQPMRKKFKTHIGNLSQVGFGKVLSLWHHDHEATDGLEEHGRSSTSLDFSPASANISEEDCILTILQSTPTMKPTPDFSSKAPRRSTEG